MKSEKLLEAIGDIKDEYIEEAAPSGKTRKPNHSWMKYAALAACFCICMFAVLRLGSGIFSMGKKEAAMDAAAPEEFFDDDAAIEESAIEEEAAAEEEAPAAEEPAEGMPTDEYPALEEGPAEEAAPEEDAPAEDKNENEAAGEDIVDVAYGVIIHGDIYFPISFEERKDYGLIDEHATGLTPENTYQITSADLGDVIGTIEDCSGKPDYIGCTVYAFTRYPDDSNICIVDINGKYEFYVKE